MSGLPSYSNTPRPTPSSLPTLPPSILSEILSHLNLPTSSTLPTPPLAFLREHLSQLPADLLIHFADLTTPRERAELKEIKAKRLIWATGGEVLPLLAGTPSVRRGKPDEMTWYEGRKRWPLLWERLGGSVLPSQQPTPSSSVPLSTAEQASKDGVESLMENPRFSAFIKNLDEEEEAEDLVASKRRERAFDREQAARMEEFEESDSEEEGGGGGAMGDGESEDQENVKRVFEKRLLELFLDGLDIIPYTPIDFSDPHSLTPNRLTIQDHEDAYFDDAAEDVVESGNGELAEGEYDY